MTVKELEERTGMPRANIRFYESEGLIRPRRLDNGYRDYSEEDAAALEKIKLLRELHLDIDTIRLVQKGELSLEQALFSLRTRLEGDKVLLDRAVEVCRELERSGTEYAALEPRPWLARLEAPAVSRPGVEPPPPRPEPLWWQGKERACDHPYMRYFARMADLGIYSLIVYLISFLAFRTQALTQLGTVGEWLLNTALLGAMLLAEPFWLHYWGWTPGKWLFGLKVRNENGEKLTLEEGFRRVGGVFRTGYGFNLPIYNLYRFWKCFKEEWDCPWDAEEGLVYLKDERRFGTLIFLVWEAAYFAAVALGLAYTYAPIHTGPLTTAQYCENVNHALKVRLNSDRRLDSAGNWVEPDRPAGSFVVDLGGTEGPFFTIEEENGAVRTVTLTETGNGNVIYQSTSLYQIAAIALEGAVEGGWPLNHGDFADEMEDRWEGFAMETDTLRVVQTIERQGYEGMGQVLVAVEGKTQSYTKTVTITVLGSD